MPETSKGVVTPQQPNDTVHHAWYGFGKSHRSPNNKKESFTNVFLNVFWALSMSFYYLH